MHVDCPSNITTVTRLNFLHVQTTGRYRTKHPCY